AGVSPAVEPRRLARRNACESSCDTGEGLALDRAAGRSPFASVGMPDATPNTSLTSAGSETPSTFSLGIVDVPGHEDFVKNMVAGVGSIDLALLVVAADDGWMPQTEEHLQILTYLGVTRAVVALTKIDLVDGAEETVVTSLRERLAHSPFATAPIVPTSV